MDRTRSSNGGELSSGTLPSLFSLCNGTVSTTMAGKDLDGLIALNDNALSQQIEFILQDATMEQDENAQETTQQQNLMQQHAVRMVKAKESMSMDYDSNSQANSLSPTAAIKLETPPTSTTPITSASELSQTGLESEFTPVESPKNQIQLQITQQPEHAHQQLQHHSHPHPHPQHLQQHLLNGRRIIVRSSALNEISTINITNLNGQQLLNQLSGEEEDPELNDENLQDIEEEAKAAEAEEEPSLQFHTNAHIKLEDPAELITDTPADGSHLEFVTNGTGGPIQSTQLVLPRSITVPVSEALAHLQRRPVYISNAVGNIHGGTLVRMPAVINRNGSMTLFNVVQQNGVGGAPTTTQLIVQTATMANGNTALADGTPLMVTSSAQTNKIITGAVSPTLTASSPISASANAPVLINTNAPPTNAKTIVSNNKANFSRIMGAATAPPITSAAITEQQFETHPVASTSAAALATLNALNNSNNSLQSSSSTIPTSSPSPTSTTSTPPGSVIYQCVDCVEKFDSKDLFDIHRSGHANNMKCAICNMVLKSLKNYEKHCLRCKPYECQICGRVVRFRPNFIKHMRVHTGQQSERHKYKCEVCHKEFMSFEYFKVHKKIHNENVNLTCEICGKVFSALASLRGHSKLHSGVKLHKCDVCGKGFGQRYNLKIHARTHTGDFPYECKVCKKKLHTQSSLQTHMQVHQREQTSQAAANTSAVATSSTIRYQSSGGQGDMLVQNASPTSTHTVIKIEPRSSSSSSSSPNAKHSLRAKTVLQNLQSLKQLDIMHEHEETDGGDDRNDDTIDHDEDNNSGLSEGSLSGNGFSQSAQNLSHHSYLGVRDCRNGFNDNTSDSSNSSLNDLRPEQPHLVLGTPTRTIIINNYLASESEKEQQSQPQPPQHNQAQVIRQNKNVGGSVLQQQLLRKTPIIHSTSGLTNNIMHTTTTAAAQSVVQQTGTPSATLLNSTTSSSLSGRSIKTVTGPFATSTIIRSTHNSQQQTQPYNINTTNNSNKKHNNKNQKQQQSSLYQRNNHRNHHRRRHLTDLDDDGDDDDDDNNDDDDDDENVGVNNAKLPRPTISITRNGRRHYDDDDDMMVDEKSSPSLALTAIKVEPNLYATGDNSNEMLIKEEAIFDDSPTPNSPQSPPSSRYRMSNFDHDLDHHVDLSHSLPTYGYLLDHHTIPDSMPAQLYADDDDDFNLGHSALTGGGTSALTTDGDYIKKEWPSYSSTSGYSINGKFDEDSDVLCDAANFIYN